MSFIYKGDSTDAFGGKFLTIRLKKGIPEGFEISKAQVKIGNLPVITFEHPEFPLQINLTPSQTNMLDRQNTIYMKVFDNNGKGITCKGTASFAAKDKVV